MKKISTIIIMLLILLSMNGAYAQGGQETQPPIPFATGIDDDKEDEIRSDIEADEIQSTSLGNDINVPVFDIQTTGMRWLLAALLFIAGPLLLYVAVVAGVRLIFLSENEEEKARANRTLLYAIIGLAVMSMAYAIVQNLLNVF